MRGRVLAAHCVLATGATGAHVAAPGGDRLTAPRRPGRHRHQPLETGPGSRGRWESLSTRDRGTQEGVFHPAPQHDELQLQSLSSSPGPEPPPCTRPLSVSGSAAPCGAAATCGARHPLSVHCTVLHCTALYSGSVIRQPRQALTHSAAAAGSAALVATISDSYHHHSGQSAEDGILQPPVTRLSDGHTVPRNIDVFDTVHIIIIII